MTPEALSEFQIRIGVARQTWPKGPWDDEPDRLEWRFEGLACLAVRSVTSGAWCGYAAVPPGHPLHGRPYVEIDDVIECHGGLTFSGKCTDSICHVPEPGESEDVFWFGFDCSHCTDISPGLLRLSGERYRRVGSLGESYRSVRFVKREIERLAVQLAGWRE